MSKEEEHIGLSLGHCENSEGGGSYLLDRSLNLDRCLLEPVEMVPALISQERGSGMGGEDHGIESCALGL